MLAECPITTVHVAPDDQTISDLVLDLHDVTAGRVAYEVTAGGTRLYWCANDLLCGLGKNLGWPSGLRNGHERWEMMMQIRPMVNALVQIAHEGTSSQRAEAGRILAETRKKLYRILAEYDDADDAQD